MANQSDREVATDARAGGQPCAHATVDALCGAIDHMPGGVARGVIDADGVVRFDAFTDGWLDLFGLDEGDVVGPAERLLKHIWVDELHDHANTVLEHAIEGRSWVA